ncbi:hypothetical protein GALMADRAFT_158902 [Galerina marginata CBS 339.88]|uniref:Nephrocystin 3-like N-terminal domain-containing protein n=1 Tax=Galerina marginata (strain CBS 339.88) TaxID=685588 RepID=A0A067SYF6_GALM3|nr:hypothetical protein GALMADRAFT_158902 [Galerina marginata CBS 339.88]
MFSARNLVISGGTFNSTNIQNAHENNAGFERLERATEPSAFHDSGERFDPPKCHPNTRLEVLETITSWIDDDEGSAIIWVHGSAGIGKSAIAQTIAERCSSQKRLVASFFFSRFDCLRNNSNSLVATIAYQAALNIPEIREDILAVVKHDPLIFRRSLDIQFARLVTQPFERAVRSGYFDQPRKSSPCLIILDGLDECEKPDTQTNILDMISKAVRHVHFFFLFLICSRREQHLSMQLQVGPLREFVTCVDLNRSFFSAHDVRYFFEDKFNDIKMNHPLRVRIPSDWPNPESVNTLVKRASGQFIYASTVVKYVGSPRHRPTHRLDTILGIRPDGGTNPFADLDAFYTQIFSSIADLEKVLDILSLIVQSPISLRVERVEELSSLERGDAQLILADLTSVVTFLPHNDPLWIKITHASFADFLLDKSRSKGLWIASPSRHTTFARRCIQTITTNNREHGSAFAYNCLPFHVSKANMTPELRQDILRLTLSSNTQVSFLNRLPFITEFLAQLKQLETSELYDHHIQHVHQQLRLQLGELYSSPFLVFLVAATAASGSSKLPYLGLFYMATKHFAHLGMDDQVLDAYISFLHGPLSIENYRTLLRNFLNHPRYSGGYSLDGDRYAVAAFICLQVLCNHRLQHLPGVFIKRTQGMCNLVNTPWKWKRKFGWHGSARSRLVAFIDREEEVGLIADLKYWNFPYKLALDLLPIFLSQSGLSKKLVKFSGQSTFTIHCQMFPKRMVLAKRAVVEYLRLWDT